MSEPKNPDPMNGVSVILPDIEELLKNNKLSITNRYILRGMVYLLKSLPPIREDISTLKKHDWVSWIGNNPKLSLFIFIFLYLLPIEKLRTEINLWLDQVLAILLKLI